MALRVLMTKKKLDTKKAELEQLRAKSAELETREADLEKSIEEAQTDEEKQVVEEAINQFEADKAEHDEKLNSLANEVADLEQELADQEQEQEKEPEEQEAPKDENKEERGKRIYMEKRNVFANTDLQTRNAIFENENVKAFLNETRSAIREKRALTNVGLTIPEQFIGYIRENLILYSKLYKHVDVRKVGGDGRAVIMGTIPEAVWTECCANLNELSLTFNDVELGCWKVAGYYAVCNANLEDSDIDLASELIVAISKGIGLALDKAILYGTGTRMPLGIVTRLVQTAKPDSYPTTARTWTDLHSTNVKAINSGSMTGAQIVSEIIKDFGAAKGKYSRGTKVWVMNEATYTTLVAASVSVDAAGAIVSGVNGTMPVIGGVIEVLDFIPNNVIIGGYFDLYLLGERAGNKFASSEHVRFLADQTVFKGTARYDGLPAIAEGFVALGLSNTTPNASMEFAADNANPQSI